MARRLQAANYITRHLALWITGLILTLFQFNRAQAQFTDSLRDVSWSQGKLTFNNFRVVRPARKKRALSVGAVTSSQPGVEVSVSNLDLQRVLKITMTNRFSYNKSWISADALQDSGLLQHEQGHFDINEIYTRKTFQQLKRIKFSNNFQAEIAAVMTIMDQERSKVQQSYERQTLHGLLHENQTKWNARIENTLSSLPPYEGQRISQTLPPIDNEAKDKDLRYQ
ncbi:hypothetical protein GCM10027566_01080 [Arachidicoccus ginsenosidivorans]|jgi:hypothetical protein|uniref:DUF922 domain-containing protein n=1 Tax=Arachidicoccus ginsenosidivorans TaxID=496057 RepID=A0A5B8VN25_9BACT|nr:hypothetical protein [Arachidicoccus ginsenosidivorans]QEC72583.1 hypothetical protein FSB73_13735 [Arachidicoccus ginsenosidivorans]